MLGGTRLRRSGALPAVVRHQGPVLSRFTRSISSFRIQSSKPPTLSSARTRPVAGKLACPPSSVQPICLRFNSTTSAAPTEATSTGMEPDMSDFSSVDVSAIPEQIGYLKELGLNYGYGPTACMESLIEHIHIYAGLPWWASIIASGVVIRLLLIKPSFDAADSSAKMNNLKPKTGKLEEKLKAAQRESDFHKMAPLQAELSKIRKQHGVVMWKPFVVPFIQLPLGFGTYRIVEGMSRLPVPGLASESFGWIHDLTVADPYYIIPIVSSWTLYMSMKAGVEMGGNPMAITPLFKTMRFLMPAVTLGFTCFFPATLQLYFVTTGVLAMCQSMLLKSDNFRRAVGVTIYDRQIANAAAARQLRMMVDDLRAQREVAEREQSAARLSFIDRTLDSLKGRYEKVRHGTRDSFKDVESRASDMFGSGPGKRADGSAAAPPRLNAQDRKLADEYEKRRSEEEEFKRQERNQGRRRLRNRSANKEEE